MDGAAAQFVRLFGGRKKTGHLFFGWDGSANKPGKKKWRKEVVVWAGDKEYKECKRPDKKRRDAWHGKETLQHLDAHKKKKKMRSPRLLTGKIKKRHLGNSRTEVEPGELMS